MRLNTATMLAIAVTGCATAPSWTPDTAVPRDPEARRAEREIARLSAERDALRHEEAERALAELPRVTDETARRRAVVRALRLDPTWTLDREPAEIAALAPDVLRVYDLGAVLDDGIDEGQIVPLDHRDRTFDGGELLLLRVAGRIRQALPAGAWDESATAIETAGECILVVQARSAFAPIESALDRFATAGGGSVRVSATARRGDDVRELAFDVPYGRMREAWDGTETSYVKDFDVDAGSGAADPVIDTLRDGIALAACFGPGEGKAPTLALDVTSMEIDRPIPEFSTTLSKRSVRAVRLQIPGMRFQRFHEDIEVASELLTRTERFHEGIQVTTELETTTRAPGVWTVDVRIDPARAAASSARPAWRRVAGSATTRTAEAEPLVENALRLAEVQAEHGTQGDTVATLRDAVLTSRSTRWTRRIRLLPGGTRAVLLRRPVARPKSDVLAALDQAEIHVPERIGFLAVEGGTLAACVEPESVAALVRALGSLDRAPAAAAPLTIASGRPDAVLGCGVTPARGPVATCSDASQVSYISDFDLDVAENAVVADPIIGVLRSGAAIEARPVASEPGLYDVRVEHSVLERPIPTFSTSLGVGGDVTIQLPRMRRRVETTRVHLDPGASVAATSSLWSGTVEDERRFVLTRE
jgi:hypothetical protein